METLFTYDGLYNDINETFSKAKNHCDEINGLRNNVNSSIVEGEKLTNETRGFILDFQNNVQVRIDRIENWNDIDHFAEITIHFFQCFLPFTRSLYRIFIQFCTP